MRELDVLVTASYSFSVRKRFIHSKIIQIRITAI